MVRSLEARGQAVNRLESCNFLLTFVGPNPLTAKSGQSKIQRQFQMPLNCKMEKKK